MRTVLKVAGVVVGLVGILALSTGLVWLISVSLLGETVAPWWMYLLVAIGGWGLTATIYGSAEFADKRRERMQ